MTNAHRTLLALAVLLVTAAAAHAQPAPPAADLTGPWTLQASAFPEVPPPGAVEGGPCNFQGSADITQTDGTLSGDASMDLVSGPENCPSSMSASLTGEVSGSDIQMGMLIDGGLGQATFNGVIDGQPPPAQGGAMSVSGTFQVTQGPFAGYLGPWSGVPGGGPSPLEIPTLTAAGLAVLALLLVGAAVVLIFRRRAA